MTDRAQWLCELAGMVTGAAGAVLISAALGGLLGAGLALLVLAVPLLVIGNMKGGGG